MVHAIGEPGQHWCNPDTRAYQRYLQVIAGEQCAHFGSPCNQPNMTISELTGLLGLIFGLIGTSIGVFNFWRDRGRLFVRLQWDLAVKGEPEGTRIGCITVTNTGRRAMFISHVALRLPKGGDLSHFLIRGGLAGQKLAEGDSPAVFPVDQGGLEDYAHDWKNIRAQVSDSTGKEWISKKVTGVPLWARAPKISVKTTASLQNGSRSSP